MAVIVPTGKATASATPVVTIVPATSGRMPWCAGSNDGVHEVSVRNSHSETTRKNATDSTRRVNTIPVVTATEEYAATARANWTNRSFQYLLPGPSISVDGGGRGSAGAAGGVNPAAIGRVLFGAIVVVRAAGFLRFAGRWPRGRRIPSRSSGL